jgi:hypothetical protein
MKEYIEREVVISELECLPDQGELDYLGVFDCVKNTSAADVVPVVHGEWIPIVNYFHGKPDGRYYCSECRRVVNKHNNFCPDCGARMDGGNK